jgi:hypothetical protein
MYLVGDILCIVPPRREGLYHTDDEEGMIYHSQVKAWVVDILCGRKDERGDHSPPLRLYGLVMVSIDNF